ncbi:MAG: hypothetical protein RLZZ142_2488 [Verrucomicrobiota bacterium]
MQTRILPGPGAPSLTAAVECAAEWLERGQVVGLPTETVYGLGGDALNPEAAARIFEAKERPFFDPLICHLPSEAWLERLTQVPAGACRVVDALREAFWPGPLTLVLPRRAVVPDLVSSGLPTVAVRRSAHPLFSAVLDRFGRPVAAPSANRFGRISPTCALHVERELGGRIPMVLDGGPTEHGLESTIVAVDGQGRMRILRSGPVTREQLEDLGEVLAADAANVVGAERPEAPGQLASHYAPRTPMELVAEGAPICVEGEPVQRVGLLAWREARPGFAVTERLSESGDLREAAATLFAKMRALDESGVDRIVAEAVPSVGLGVAINDRLRRASAR